MITQASEENLRAEYQQVCNNFRLLTDIRFKLLAFLPIGTGAGVALTVGGQPSVSSPLIGLFGLIVTLAIALYNERNNQLYNELVARAAEIERRLKLTDGAFAQRPRDWLRAGPFRVNHAKVWWIYLASATAWLFTAVHGARLLEDADLILDLSAASVPFELVELMVAALVVGVATWLIQRQAEHTRRHLRTAARAAVDALCAVPLPPARDDETWRDAVAKATALADQDATKTEGRLLFYLSDRSGFYWDRPPDGQRCDKATAAMLLALTVDLPVRWIYDVASERR